MNDENIMPHRFGKGSAATAQRDREIQSAGGRARGRQLRERKRMKELLALALEEIVENKNGQKATKKEVAAIQIANAMAKGNLRATELGLKILGELEEKVNVETKDVTEPPRYTLSDLPEDLVFELADRMQESAYKRRGHEKEDAEGTADAGGEADMR